MNEFAVSGYDTRMKMNPPLRCEEDREGIVRLPMVPDSSLGSHSGKSRYEKSAFYLASCGGPGLETIMPMTAKLVHGGQLSWQRALNC